MPRGRKKREVVLEDEIEKKPKKILQEKVKIKVPIVKKQPVKKQEIRKWPGCSTELKLNSEKTQMVCNSCGHGEGI